jgi:hypothetical protein
MLLRFIFSLSVAFLLAFSCDRPPELSVVEYPSPTEARAWEQDAAAELVSLVSVLADPAKYDGQRIGIQGVLNLEFEGDQVCLDRGSLQYLVTKNCLWVRLAEGSTAEAYEDIARWNGHYAFLEGEIRSSDQGHFGLFAAAIVEVTRVVVVEPPGRG